MASDCPRGLQGVEWLTAQGARGAFIQSASGLINPELTSALVHWAANTAVPLPEDPNCEPWQNAVTEYRRQSMKALDFDPARMVQYAAGRPCVVRTQQNKRIIRGGLVQSVITRFIPDSDADVSVRFVVDYDGITGSRAI